MLTTIISLLVLYVLVGVFLAFDYRNYMMDPMNNSVDDRKNFEEHQVSGVLFVVVLWLPTFIYALYKYKGK